MQEYRNACDCYVAVVTTCTFWNIKKEKVKLGTRRRSRKRIKREKKKDEKEKRDQALDLSDFLEY